MPDAADVAGTPLVALLDWAAELAYLTGNNTRAAELIGRAIELSDVDAEPARAASRYERLGTYLLPAGQREQGLAAFRRAVELVPAQPPTAERVRVLAALGNALLLSDRYDESRQACQQALDLAATIGDRRSAFRAADVLAPDLCYLGRLDEGLAMLFAACEPDPERDTPPYLLRPYVHLSDVLILAGRLPDAIRIAYEGLVTARRLGVERGPGTVLACNLAEALLGTGDWERADDVLTAALRNGGTFWSHSRTSSAPSSPSGGASSTRRGSTCGPARRPPPNHRPRRSMPSCTRNWRPGRAPSTRPRTRSTRLCARPSRSAPSPAGPVVRARAAGGSRPRAAGHRPARRPHDRPSQAPSPAAPAGRPAVRPRPPP